MWSGPRNISTALMYSFRQRPDTTVVDEPFYGHYLAVTGLEHPGYRDILAAMDQDGDRVVAEVLYADCERSVRFYKNMAHHAIGIDLAALDGLTNILLTRDPREMLLSLTKELPDTDLQATALPDQVRMLDHLEASGERPIVLLASEVLRDPRTVLGKLCERLGIPWFDEMLAWPTGPKPEDGVWAAYWYASVHRSTGFGPHRSRKQAVPEHLEPLLADCLPLYERLAEHAIQA